MIKHERFRKVTLTRLAAVSRDLVYLGTTPDDQELGTPFTGICQFNDGEWSYETFSSALASLSLFRSPKDKHRVLYVLFEKGEVVNFHTKSVETILSTDSPLRKNHRLGYLHRIRQIGDHLYACGAGAQVYKRNSSGEWLVVDQSILDGPDQNLSRNSKLFLFSAEMLSKSDPSAEDFEKYKRLLFANQSNSFLDIQGKSDTDFYVCGEKSAIYWSDGSVFRKIKSDSNSALLAICRESEERLWVCGRDGELLSGNKDSGFNRINGFSSKPNFSSMAFFSGRLYIGSYASPRGLFVYDGHILQRVMSGLSPDIEDVSMIEAIDDVLWVMGSKDLLRYDGRTWERFDFPA